MKKIKPKDPLIETASRLFKLRGYCGVGLNDIIAESGVPKGSLYHYFPDGKEQLAIAAIDYTKTLVMEDIRSVFAVASTPLDAFQVYVYELSKVFGEGGILLALTMKSGKPLEAIAEQIPFLFIKK